MIESLSHVRLVVTPGTLVCQALSVGFPRQEYWGGLPFPSPGNPPDPEMGPRPPALQVDSLLTEQPKLGYAGQHEISSRYLEWCVA